MHSPGETGDSDESGNYLVIDEKGEHKQGKEHADKDLLEADPPPGEV